MPNVTNLCQWKLDVTMSDRYLPKTTVIWKIHSFFPLIQFIECYDGQQLLGVVSSGTCH